jgi:P27 family predicted phage terminase small subunit
MAGRKKIPTKLKELRGTLAKSREIENEMQVTPVTKAPTPPKWLSKIAKQQWVLVTNELFMLGMLHTVDLALIEAYCNSIALHIETEQILQETGRIQVYRDEDGRVKHSQIVPLVTVSKQALSDAIKLATQFGLTPSARTKISAERPLENKDEYNFFE